MTQHFPFSPEPLSYTYSALEPFIDRETMYLHYTKHCKNISELNKLIEGKPKLRNAGLFELAGNTLSRSGSNIRSGRYPMVGSDIYKIGNLASAVIAHVLYFGSMSPPSSAAPRGSFAAAIVKNYGSIDNFTNKMKEAALNSPFSYGFVWFGIDRRGNFTIIAADKHNLPPEISPIFSLDLWEHAYFIKYQWRREDYIDGFLKLLSFPSAESRYIEITERQYPRRTHPSISPTTAPTMRLSSSKSSIDDKM